MVTMRLNNRSGWNNTKFARVHVLWWFLGMFVHIYRCHEVVDDTNLLQLLTHEERYTYFGTTRKVPTFAVVMPRLPEIHHAGNRQKRSSEVPHHIGFDAMGRHFNFTLWPSQNLLSENFVMLVRRENQTDIYPEPDGVTGCFYKGKVTRTSLATNQVQEDPVAMGLCGGMRGFITSRNEYYVLQPLPHRFHKRSVNMKGIDIPHVLYKKLPPKTVCRHHHKRGQHKQHRREHNFNKKTSEFQDVSHTNAERNISHSGRRIRRRISSYENKLYIETAVFVDRDLYKHMQMNFPSDTKREVIRIVLAMINAVQLLYNDESLGHQIDFVLKRLEILESDPTNLLRPYDIDRFLTSFCKWQRVENPANDADALHWDHALILTGLDLYVVNRDGKISNQVVGLAPVAGMCTRSSSCTVNEGRHFESVYVVAHEIGHNLGMRHDGRQADNDCDPGSYIMSPTLGSGKITWSSCSKRYLDIFLNTVQSRCLRDHSLASSNLDHGANGQLPGERFDSDKQCLLKYGRGSKHATQQALPDVCRDLHCRREHYTWTSHPALDGTHCGKGMASCPNISTEEVLQDEEKKGSEIWTSHPALEGTTCGADMWCRNGQCVSRNSRYKISNASPRPVHGGWGKWTPFTKCASGCLYGEDGRLSTGSSGIMVSTRKCDKPRPEHGGQQCHGADSRYKICNAVKQCASVPKTSVRAYGDEICTRAAEVDAELRGRGVQRTSTNPDHACAVWCYKKNGGFKSRSWMFPDGTTCKIQDSRPGKPFFCMKGRCQEFSCDTNGVYSMDQDDCSTVYRGESLLAQDWGAWIPSGDCRFNCMVPAKGIRLVKRVCRSYDCAGLDTSIQLCEPKNPGCPHLKTPFEYATSICTKYRIHVDQLSGIGMQLSATLDNPDRPCKVACQDDFVSYRFYMVNGEEGWFPFGTDCSRGVINKKAYCLNGRCLEFGNENTPLHKVEYVSPIRRVFRRDEYYAHRVLRSLTINATRIAGTIDKDLLLEIIRKLNLQGDNASNDDYTNSKPSINMSTPPVDINNPVYVSELPVITSEPEINNKVPTDSHLSDPLGKASRMDVPEDRATAASTNVQKWEMAYSGTKMVDKLIMDSTNPGYWESHITPIKTSNIQLEGVMYDWQRIVSDCSVTCGPGIKEIIVQCTSGDVVVEDNLCNFRTKPGTSGYVTCRHSSCSTNQTPPHHSAYWRWFLNLLGLS